MGRDQYPGARPRAPGGLPCRRAPLIWCTLCALACAAEAPGPTAQGRTEVRLFTSPDAESWTLSEHVVARDWGSLGLSVREDGALWLTAVDHAARPGWLDGWLGPHVVGLRLDPDDPPTAWEPDQWRPRDPETPAFIDPQWQGDVLWYMSSRGTEGDPVGPNRVNQIRSTPPATTHWEGRGVADPAPAIFKGEPQLFITAFPAQLVHLAGDPLHMKRTWAGKTVPYAIVVDGVLWLYAQDNVNGRRQPVRTSTRDAIGWTDWSPVIPYDSVKSCTSPVVGPHVGAWVLLCVNEELPEP